MSERWVITEDGKKLISRTLELVLEGYSMEDIAEQLKVNLSDLNLLMAIDFAGGEVDFDND